MGFPYANWGNKGAMTEAIENNDYSAWLAAVGEDSRMTEMVTAENFSKFVEMHNLMQEGNYEEAREIREELGILDRRGWLKE